MRNELCATGFGKVDQMADPQSFVNYLDIISSADAVKAYKLKTFDLLQAQRGSRVLDVGCGLGDDARWLATLVGHEGKVIGVDSSRVMVSAAQERTSQIALPLEFRYGDVYRLDFQDGAFDRCRADRVFQHLEEPERALAEMARVIRAGGRLVVSEPDYGSLVIDADDRELTNKILEFYVSNTRQGWIGRRLFGLFNRSGLTEVTMVADTMILTSYAFAEKALGVETVARQAGLAGVISVEEASRWVQKLEQADRERRFFCAVTGFISCGIKP
jgi:ubiquinone/menaquinone biosynthesis C-methylase UbiE